jgi:hypothetical protein
VEGELIGSNRGEIRGSGHISLTKELRQHLADVAAYKARISFLESKLVQLGFKEDASNNGYVDWADKFFGVGIINN